MFKAPNQYRVTPDLCDKNRSMPQLKQFISTDADGNVGAFMIPAEGKTTGSKFFVISSDHHGWEHVMVSIARELRYPTWPEMNHIKKMFWSDDECVLQYHPPADVKGNNLPSFLHLWKPKEAGKILMPGSHLVDIKSMLKVK